MQVLLLDVFYYLMYTLCNLERLNAKQGNMSISNANQLRHLCVW